MMGASPFGPVPPRKYKGVQARGMFRAATRLVLVYHGNITCIAYIAYIDRSYLCGPFSPFFLSSGPWGS